MLGDPFAVRELSGRVLGRFSAPGTIMKPMKARSDLASLALRIVVVGVVAPAVVIAMSVAGWLVWGDDDAALLPTWIESIANVMIFAAAGVAAVLAASAYRIETRREERWQADNDRGQARQVAAWVQDHNSYWIANSSGMPIYRVELCWHPASAPLEPLSWKVPMLPPTGGAPTLMQIPDQIAAQLRERHDPQGALLSLIFTDASGLRWERRRRGRLVALGADPRVTA